MDKTEIKNLLLEVLTKDYEGLIATALEAKLAATHEESKPENKYDTRGLEASYLAGAQAKRADELRVIIDKLSKLNVKEPNTSGVVELTSLVEVEDQDGNARFLFVLPFAGGTKLVYKNRDVFVISTVSPVGEKIIGLGVGDEMAAPNNKSVVYEILEIY